MPRAQKQDWIPTQIKAFRDKQDTYFAKVAANKVAWDIPDAAILPLTTLQTEFVGLYEQIKDKKNRTSAKVGLFHDCMRRYAKAWRLFHKAWVAFNPAISRDDMIILVGKDYDTKPTRRGKISGFPFVNLKAVGGGSIEVRVRVEKDPTRPSMHPLADGVECRWMLVPKGEMTPAGHDEAKNTVVSRKAIFTISCGDQNAGDSFWGFFRWANLTTPANSGDWTEPIKVVVS
jgi:hypothetical protein